MNIRASSITAQAPGVLRVVYTDGSVTDVDIAAKLRVGVFAALTDFELFSRVQVDEIGGAEWPNGASLAPEFLLSHKPAVRTLIG